MRDCDIAVQFICKFNGEERERGVLAEAFCIGQTSDLSAMLLA